ncbi:MAG: hypothetical protein ACI84K_000250 [Pseudohongiellaceae bacterium]|jgi:hypothetical protein
MIGIGNEHCTLAVYIGNRPPLDEYLKLEGLVPAVEGELARIGRETGNHWRKIINIYAKLGFALNTEAYLSWQSYRDTFLLTQASRQALLFDKNIVTAREDCINLICGKTYAMNILDKDSLVWLNQDFAINASNNIIVTPYFDYRQLSNIKLEKLVTIIREHLDRRGRS